MKLERPFQGALVAILLALTACGGAMSDARRDPHADVAMASARRTKTDDAVFDGPVLERKAFVQAVLDRNPSIEAARQGWRGALARIGQAGAFDDPMVDVGVAPLSIASAEARFGWQASLTQKVPWFGKRAFESAVASAEARASRGDFEVVRRELALTAALLYDDYFLSFRSLEINVHHGELLRVLREAASAQLETGRATLRDTLQADVELAHLEHDAVVLGTTRDVLSAQMNELLHRDPRLPLPLPPKELPREGRESPVDPKLETDAADRRPEVEAARERARAEEARVTRAQRESWPDLSVSTSYNTMWDMPEHRWMVGLGLNIPIQTGRRAAGVDEAEAARARYESEALRLSDTARTEVVVARARLDESRRLIELFEARLLPVARRQVDATRAAFVTSQAPFSSAIEAERNLRHVELDCEMVRVERDKREAQLERALGRLAGGGR